MGFIVKVSGRYEVDNLEELDGVKYILSEVDALWDELSFTYEYDYLTGSKYGAVRPTIEALDIFDRIATDEYYHPWPIELKVETD